MFRDYYELLSSCRLCGSGDATEIGARTVTGWKFSAPKLTLSDLLGHLECLISNFELTLSLSSNRHVHTLRLTIARSTCAHQSGSVVDETVAFLAILHNLHSVSDPARCQFSTSAQPQIKLKISPSLYAGLRTVSPLWGALSEPSMSDALCLVLNIPLQIVLVGATVPYQNIGDTVPDPSARCCSTHATATVLRHTLLALTLCTVRSFLHSTLHLHHCSSHCTQQFCTHISIRASAVPCTSVKARLSNILCHIFVALSRLC